ncbi:MAG: hypothetical protein PVI19_08710, partial [Syntrophobacterales bacterium]
MQRLFMAVVIPSMVLHDWKIRLLLKKYVNPLVQLFSILAVVRGWDGAQKGECNPAIVLQVSVS